MARRVEAKRSPIERDARIRLVVDEDHLRLVVEELLLRATVSLWIATANVKDMMVEAPVGTAARARNRFVSVVERMEALAAPGVEFRLLHASRPSKAFQTSLSRQRRLRSGALSMRMCPRVHLKMIVMDGKWAYLGSANFTGAGLGAKGSGRRNFEMGVLVSDDVLLDVIQARFDEIWSGKACGGCGHRARCPAPLDS